MEEGSPIQPEIKGLYRPKDKIEERREILGPIIHETIKSPNMPEAHRRLGEMVGQEVQSIIGRKLESLSEEEFADQIRFTRSCRQLIEKKLNEPTIDEKIKDGLKEYFDSLKAWAEGAKLSSIEGLGSVDQQPVSGEELAFWLQNDNLGCQTGMLREKDGSVIVWHTEEEGDLERIGSLRIISFKINGEEKHVFLYPDLLPGPAFGWQKDFFQAVDFLYLKEPEKAGALANVAVWLIWRLGNQIEPERVIESLAPYVDGYALNIVRIKNGQVEAKKIEFAHGQIAETVLGSKEGDYSFQVNLPTPGSAIAETKQSEFKEEPKKLRKLNKRIVRTRRAIELIKNFTKKGMDLENVWRMLSFRLGEGYAYAGEDTVAHLVGKISNEGIKLGVGPGPAIKEGKYIELT